MRSLSTVLTSDVVESTKVESKSESESWSESEFLGLFQVQRRRVPARVKSQLDSQCIAIISQHILTPKDDNVLKELILL